MVTKVFENSCNFLRNCASNKQSRFGFESPQKRQLNGNC